MNISTSRRAAAMIVMLILLLLAPLRAYAAGSSVNIAVKEDVRAGNEFTMTVSFSSDKQIGMVSAALSYSKSDIEFIGSEHATGGGDGIVNISGSPTSASESMDIILRFRALSGGTTSVSVTNGTILSPDGAVIDGSLSAGAEISVTGETRPPEPKESTLTDTDSSMADESSLAEESTPDSSSEADSSSMIPDDGGKARLSSIVITADDNKAESGTAPEQFRLKPEFSPDVFEYEVTVHNDTEYISVDAVLRDKLDTIWYDGSVYLPVGMTPWTITVTTADGTISHAYFIRVIRHEEGWVEESSEEESSSEAAVTTAAESYDPDKPSDQAEPPKTPDVVEPPRQPERPLREKLMPVLIIAICVIAAAVLFIVIRIRMRSKRPATKITVTKGNSGNNNNNDK